MKADFYKTFWVLLMLSALAAVSPAQKLSSGGKPRPANVSGLVRAQCASAAPAVRVCKALKAVEDGDGVFVIEQNQKTVGTIEAAIGVQSQPENFYVFYGDLDKNGSAELIVVDFKGQSMGMGVSYYEVNIFPDLETRGFQTPLVFSTYEFGAEGSFVYDAALRETLILATEWQDYDTLDPRRGSGLYLIGRFFRYQNGKLKPAAGKPILARRYLNSFEIERGRTLENPRIPYLWLNAPGARRLAVDPEFMTKPESSRAGVVEKYERVKEQATDEAGEVRQVEIEQITVRFDSGKTETIILTKSEGTASLAGDRSRIFPERFGVLPQQFALPTDFEPTLVFDRFEGRKVRLDAFKPYYADAENPSERIYKLWFVEN